MAEIEGYALPYVISISLILIIEMVAGFLSNMVVLLSYHVNKQFQQNASDLIITNMNIVDLVICIISIPLTLIVIIRPWSNPFVCYIHEATISFASVASALNVLVISLDRHDKITNPLRRRISVRTVRWVIIVTWGLSIIGFITPFVGLRSDLMTSFPDGNSTRPALCYEWFQITRSNNYYELYHVPVFFLASAVMIYAYYSIIRVTRVKTIHSALVRATTVPFHARTDQQGSGSSKNVERANTPNSAHRDPEKRVSRTTTIILLTFIVCWGPHTAISIVILVKGRTELYDLLEWWFATLAYTTILMHPILYVFMRRNFRRAFGNSCLGKLLWRNRVAPGRTPTPTNIRPNFAASKKGRKSTKEAVDNTRHNTQIPSVVNRQNLAKEVEGKHNLRRSERLEQKKRKGNIEVPPSALFITLSTGLDRPTTSDVHRGPLTRQASVDDVKEMYLARESLNVLNVE